MDFETLVNNKKLQVKFSPDGNTWYNFEGAQVSVSLEYKPNFSIVHTYDGKPALVEGGPIAIEMTLRALGPVIVSAGLEPGEPYKEWRCPYCGVLYRLREAPQRCLTCGAWRGQGDRYAPHFKG